MKKLYNSFLAAFSMYSTLPMPRFNWDGSSFSYVFIFFPFVAFLIGLVEIFWLELARFYGFGALFYACVACVVPIFITGGIHADGFMDVCDALKSNADLDKKRLILDDPHVGAFAALFIVVYFILSAGVYSQLYYKYINFNIIPVLFFAYFLSRVCCGILAVVLKKSGGSILLKSFTDNVSRRYTLITLGIYIFVSFLLIFVFFSAKILVLVLGMVLIHFVWFYKLVVLNLGGMSGDAAGFYVMSFELLFLAIFLFV